MVVGFACFHLQIPGIRSRKEKRAVINSLKHKLRNSHNIAASEIDFHDNLQRSAIGISTVSLTQADAERCIDAVCQQIESTHSVLITHVEKEFY